MFRYKGVCLDIQEGFALSMLLVCSGIAGLVFVCGYS